MAIWITGAASGIGAAVADRLRGQGGRVIGIDRAWPDGAGPDDRTCDLSDLGAVARLTDAWVADAPAGLVNCAGVSDTAAPQTVFTVIFLAARLLGEALVALGRPAAIVEVASGVAANWRLNAAQLLDMAIMPDAVLIEQAIAMSAPALPPYTLSKQLLCAHAIRLAARGNPLGIRVNCALPGPVETPLLAQFRQSMGHGSVEWTRAKAGRFGTAGEIAAAICFLLSDDARWISGAELQIDGGLRALAMVSPRA